MADTASTPKAAQGNTATRGEHDRVQMLSLHPDGKPAQLDPELIGEPEATLAATKEQFRQQAVSAVDAAERDFGAAGGEVAEDPSIAALKKKHDAAAKAAEGAAEQVVKGLSS